MVFGLVIRETLISIHFIGEMSSLRGIICKSVGVLMVHGACMERLPSALTAKGFMAAQSSR